MKNTRFAIVALLLMFSLCSVLLTSLPVDAAVDLQSPPVTAGKVTSNANLRSGPGTNHAIVGSASTGELIAIKGCNEACDWYQLDTGEWIAAFLVDTTIDQVASTATPQVTVIATASISPAAKLTPVATPRATQQAMPARTNSAAAATANLRAGPKTAYEIVGSTRAGDTLVVTGTDATGTWLLLDSGNWIARDLVNGVPGSLPTVDIVASIDSIAVPRNERTAVLLYLAEMYKVMNDYTDASYALSDYFSDISRNPFVLLNPDWKMALAVDLAVLGFADLRVLEMEPPASLKILHAEFWAAATLIDEAIYLIAEGVDEIDPAKIAEATELIVEATGHIEAGSALMGKVDTGQ